MPSNDPSDASASTPLAPLPPLMNPKYRHISRSAAKRESVQMLGSIKDLQLHFSRAGLVEHRPGTGVGVKGMGGIREAEDEENTPFVTSGQRNGDKEKRGERRPWKEVDMVRLDNDQVRREVSGTIGRLRNLWNVQSGSISHSTSSNVLSPSASSTFGSGSTVGISSPTTPGGRKRQRSTHIVLVDTARAIRRVRDLSLSFTSTTIQNNTRRVSGPNALSSSRNKRYGFSTPSRPSVVLPLPRAVSYTTSSTVNVPPNQEDQGEPDALVGLRKAALDVLAGLRSLEEVLRIDTTDERGIMTASPVAEMGERAFSPDTSTISTNESGQSESTRPTSTTFTDDNERDAQDLRHGQHETDRSYEYDEDEEYSFNSKEDDQRVVRTWEERIIDECREYRELEEAEGKVNVVREAVQRWLVLVEALFGVKEVSGELEAWATKDWAGRSADQVHAFLMAHLPADLQSLLPPSSAEGSNTLLSILSDGFILTQAYNAAIASSSKPWGYITNKDIHDTLRLDSNLGEVETDEPRDKEWTFRRVGNLTCWAAALRLRYNLPILMPSNTSSLTVPPAIPIRSTQPSPSTLPIPARPSRIPSPLTLSDRLRPRRRESAPSIDFDPRIVAKREEGWEGMLEVLLGRWVEEAAREARGASDGGIGADD